MQAHWQQPDSSNLITSTRWQQPGPRVTVIEQTALYGQGALFRKGLQNPKGNMPSMIKSEQYDHWTASRGRICAESICAQTARWGYAW